MRKVNLPQSYHQSMALCAYIDACPATVIAKKHKDVAEMWSRVFFNVARELGFNKATRRILWRDLVVGNWDRLHLTEDEREMAPHEWIQALRSDVWYCSDRWSLDRLARCHWLYRQYVMSIKLGVGGDPR